MENNPIEEYKNHCTDFFGVFMDGIWGFKEVRKFAEKSIKEAKISRKVMPHLVFDGRPHDPKKKEKTEEEFNQSTLQLARADLVVERNRLNGKNGVVLAQMSVVNVYQYWEDKYRELIAQYLGLNKVGDLKIDAMGDLRFLRQAIIHNQSIATRDVERCRVFNWFKRGENISLDYEMMLQIKEYFRLEFQQECERCCSEIA